VTVPAGEYVTVQVSDDGTGIAPDKLEKVFEPFFTTKHKRTGLGLSACYGIAKRHGGTIDVTSTPGQGTTFAVRIPHANEVDARAEADAPSAIAPQATVKAKPKKFDNVSILLVEDDETVRIAMTDLLHSIGASVNSVNNGPSAIELLKTNDSFDILITDLLMEEMDGVELLEECRQFSDVPVVMMSGWPRRRVNERLEGKPKPDAILSKPCKFGDIVRTLEEHAFKRKAVVGRS
jgi:two-component system cell cycle sensor histidine kinase/response regulator CckA